MLMMFSQFVSVLFVKGSWWTLSILLSSYIGSIWRLSLRSSFTFSVVSAVVSLFMPSGSLTPAIMRQDCLEYCLRQSTSLASSFLVRFDKSASLCHSWTICSKLFRQFFRFWIFWSWSWIIDINSSLECCWDADYACVWPRWWCQCIILSFDVASFISIGSFDSGHLYFRFSR